MTPLDVNTMNHIDGVYAFCAVAATGMLLLLVRVFKQERAKPSRSFEKPSRIFEKPSRIFEKPSRIFEKPSRRFEKPSRIKRQKEKRHKQKKARWCGAVQGNVFKSFSCADTRRISGKNGRVPGTASVSCVAFAIWVKHAKAILYVAINEHMFPKPRPKIWSDRRGVDLLNSTIEIAGPHKIGKDEQQPVQFLCYGFPCRRVIRWSIYRRNQERVHSW